MKFDKEKFEISGPYVHYEGKFVARFKRGGRGPFLTFLRKNFTVEEYFEATAGERIDNTPLKVLESKGYLQAHVKKALKAGGYPVTVAGRDQMIKDEMKAAGWA